MANRKYLEPKHGPQFTPEAPKDFPRVVNGVPTASSGLEDEADRSIPPSPGPGLRKLGSSGVIRTISGSQMDLAELSSIMENAAVPKEARSSYDSRSSTGERLLPPKPATNQGCAVAGRGPIFREDRPPGANTGDTGGQRYWLDS